MPGSSNFLQWNPSQTNQENDAAYLADSQRSGGAPTGNVFPSQTGNKLFYQLSTFVAAFAQMMATKGYSMSDANLSTLASVLSAVLTSSDLRQEIQSVPWASTVNLDASKYNGFQVALNGNTTVSITGAIPGQLIRLIFQQDGVGGRTVTFPGNWIGSWQPDPNPNIATTIFAEVDAAGAFIKPSTPPISDYGIISIPINNSGNPAIVKVPNRTAGDSTTNAANTAFVTAAIAAAIGALGISIGPGNTVNAFGLIFKWGETPTFDTGPTGISFGTNFPTACWQVLMTDSYDDGNVTTRIWEVASISPSGFQCRNNGSGSGKWLAIGH